MKLSIPLFACAFLVFLNVAFAELLKELVSSTGATVTASKTAIRPQSSYTFHWTSLKPPSLPNTTASFIMRPTMSATSTCATTLEDKAALPFQTILPAILLNGNTGVSFKLEKIFWKQFCFYFQKDLNIDDEILVADSEGTSAVFTPADQTATFCNSCGAESLSCNPLTSKCNCPAGLGTFYTDSCIAEADWNASNLKFSACSTSNTNWQASTASTNTDNKCLCNNLWSGAGCALCSLTSCSLWSGTDTCYTCATVNDVTQSPNSDCSRCVCSSPYYRGVTCACRSAIFDLKIDTPNKTAAGQPLVFSLPFPSAAARSHASLSKADSQTLTDQEVANTIYQQKLRLSLAIDLNIPVSDIEILLIEDKIIRFTISPWCATTFSKIWEKQNFDATRVESGSRATNEVWVITRPESDDIEALSNQEATHAPKVSSALRQLSQQAQATRTVPLGVSNFDPQIDKFGILSNTDNTPFFDLQARVENLIANADSSLFMKIANDPDNTGSNTLGATAQPIYFPGCTGDDRCADLSSDPYAIEEKSYTTIIIIVVVVGAVLILVALGVSIVYCNNKKICCFKAIHEANERRRKKEKEKQDKSSTGSGGKHSHSTTDSESGSNSARPGTATGTITATHNSSTSNLQPDPYRSSGSNSHSGMGHSQLARRPPSTTGRTSRGMSQSGGRRISRSGSQSGGVEMSQRGASRRESGGGRRISRGADNRAPMGSPQTANRDLAAPPVSAGTTPLDDGEPPLPDGWEKHTAGDGKIYYVNNETLTSSWVHPLKVNSNNNGDQSDSLDDLVEE